MAAKGKAKDSKRSKTVASSRRKSGSSRARSGGSGERSKRKGSGESKKRDKPAPKSFSLRGYARHRKAAGLAGGSLAAVQKAIRDGRISVDDAGRIDPELADREWSENTNRRKAPSDPSKCTPKTDPLSNEEESFTYSSERAKKERIERQLRELDLKTRLGELVLVERVAAINFRVGRQIRTRLEALPDRLGDRIAVETDPAAIESILRDEIRGVLEALGADPSGAGGLDDQSDDQSDDPEAGSDADSE